MAGKVPRTSTDEIHKRLKKHVRILKTCLGKLEQKRVCFLRVISCNGDCAVCFTNAWCETERITDEGHTVFKQLYDIKKVTNMLENGILPPDSSDAEKQQLMDAFQKLAQFFDKSEETIKFIKKYEHTTENAWSVLYGNHVLKKLAVTEDVVFSDVSYADSMCACGCQEPTIYGDTSMGNMQVWHGSVDILLGSVAVAVPEPDDPSGVYPKKQKLDSSTGVEVKLEKVDKYRHQIVAETITAGCCRGYFPLITLSKRFSKVLVYHFQHDLLLESEEFSVFAHEGFVALWLIVNHSLFARLVKGDKVKEGVCSSFKTFIQQKNKIDIYTKEMRVLQCRKGNHPDTSSTVEFFCFNAGNMGSDIWKSSEEEDSSSEEED